jgi:hypothetical protein
MMEHGVRVHSETLQRARERAASQRSALPPGQRRLDPDIYPVAISDALAALTEQLANQLTSTDAARSPDLPTTLG